MTVQQPETTTIRPFRDDDAAAAARVFFDAVHHAPGNRYDAAQLRAWTAAPPDTRTWRQRLASQTCFVAERQGAVIGFMTIDRDGYIDLAFVAPHALVQRVTRNECLAFISSDAKLP